MKIVEETRTRLQLKHRPLGYWFSGGCIFTICLSFLIYCLVFDSASVKLTCVVYRRRHRISPNQINCELKRFNLLGSMEKLKMFDLQEAYILTKTGSKGGKTYQVMIVTPFETLPYYPMLAIKRIRKLSLKSTILSTLGKLPY
ncbi:hypothetical protein [Nostoc sp.]|uniref:hypothetical protein n=1 Tax=Nostoc sp. TaxID=1180 RepID=UPI002FF6323B